MMGGPPNSAASRGAEAMGHTGWTWIQEYGLEDASFETAYLTSVHFALAQSGFAPTDMYPVNSYERVYACMCGFSWLIAVSVTICLFNKWLTQLQNMTMEGTNQEIQLRKFLDEHGVSKKLTYKVMRCFRWNYRNAKMRTREEDIRFMKVLPNQLQVRLHSEMYSATVMHHPFFQVLSTCSSTVLPSLCHLAIKEHQYVSGDVVFLEGGKGESMFHVSTGELEYFAVLKDMEKTKLDQGCWACEPALWLNWTLKGRLMAKASCNLQSVSVEQVLAITGKLEAYGECECPLVKVKQFAADVVERFLEADPNTDLWNDMEAMKGIASRIFTDLGPSAFGGSSSVRPEALKTRLIDAATNFAQQCGWTRNRESSR
jgi:hypothetical protein